MLWLFAVQMLLIGCRSDANKIKVADPEDLRKELAPTEVVIAKAVKKPFIYQINANGIVKPALQAEVVVNTGGLIANLYIKPGQVVVKGQLLATINDAEQQLALAKARVGLHERKLEYESQLLAMGNRGNQQNKEELRENLAYISGLRAAELNYRQAQEQYNATRVKAPMGGLITNVKVNKGVTVKNGAMICAIYQADKMVVEAQILESVIGKVKIDQEATVRPIALPQEYHAKVHTINPVVDKNGTINLSLLLQQPQGLMPGMHVAVTINAPFNKNIIIPEAALVIRSGKEVVFVEEDGLAKWHYVTTGLKSNNEVEVLTGLEEGDMVIITNNIYLAHDSPVRIINQDQPTNIP